MQIKIHITRLEKTIEEKKNKINEIQQDIHLNIFENYTGQSNNSYFESLVNSQLNKTLETTGELALSNLDSKNKAINMVNNGRKGKEINISQMIACLGQQNVDGEQ